MLDTWLDDVKEAVGEGKQQDFRVFLFDGTTSEVRTKVQLWHRPRDLSVDYLPVADVTGDCANVRDARESVESALRRLAGTSGAQFVIVDGLNLLNTLYPEGVLQPIYAWLRAAGRIVLLVVPPLPTRSLPATSHLSDWRSSVRLGIGGDVLDKTVVGEDI
jgi:hypothetical protein